MTGGFIYTCAFFLCMNLNCAEASNHAAICYTLDGILFLYGIILTVLYCRLKISTRNSALSQKKDQGEGIYTGLTPHAQDTYDTISKQRN
ncbi:high affinity immunoglobulin epsilon receptor subunit gamma [Scleropages formosus]|uniref:High affinity immunoglobulin epsilon receptor subunit gamma-like n=1 Tax=Scleropages formosus TaxID=113540 RepID=A0A8C9S5I1_SCLFO|nr:high affinity immunoglobulin epsilon receptor subunit gamma-like [Scleropages formosus]